MGKMKNDRESAPAFLYALPDLREKLKELQELSTEVELNLKKTFQILVTKPNSYNGYPEIIRSGVASPTWREYSEHPYPREYICLWCKEKWTIRNSDIKHQSNCPNSCNVNTI
ncbi:MAG: hypothetical protein ACK6CP_02550 [Pseudanabaena sp.]|jgi:hypothetical protein|nr:hypothetical protein [Pseudanabaena sp. M109S1SP1A06QC]MCE2889133.1 hypothetical protein [Pseudanabaena sp. 42896M_M3]